MNDLLHVHSLQALLTTGRFNQIHRRFPKCLSRYLGRPFLLLSAHLTTYAPCTLKTVHFALAPAREDMRGKWKANSAGPRAPGSPPTSLLNHTVERPTHLQLQSCSASLCIQENSFLLPASSSWKRIARLVNTTKC